MRTIKAAMILGAAVAALAAMAVFYASAPAAAQMTLAVPEINLPDDERPHPNAPMEWWYFSGHLTDDEGRGYGVMASFFIARFGNMPPAHFIIYHLSEKDAGRFHSGSLIEKSMVGMMQMVVSALPEDVRGRLPAGLLDKEEIEKHHVYMKEKPKVKKDSLALKYDEQVFLNERSPGREWEEWRYWTRLVGDEFEIELEARPSRGPMFVGGTGNTGLKPGEDMHYYSFSRMEAKGTLLIGGETRRVRGELWYDHQYGVLGEAGQPTGWDWFCVQLEDGTDMNMYVIRRPDTGERYHRLATVKWGDGRMSVARDIVVEPLSQWTSPDTGTTYPLSWAIAIPSLRAHLTITQDMPNQEMRTFGPMRAIWEGSGRAAAVIDGKPLAGNAYTELVGYGALAAPSGE